MCFPTPAAFSAASKFRAGSLEESQHCLFLEDRQVGEIDHDLGTGEGFGQSFSGDGVDAGFGDAATTSCPFLRSRSTVFDPMSPLPPNNFNLHVSDSLMEVSRSLARSSSWSSHRPAEGSDSESPLSAIDHVSKIRRRPAIDRSNLESEHAPERDAPSNCLSTV